MFNRPPVSPQRLLAPALLVLLAACSGPDSAPGTVLSEPATAEPLATGPWRGEIEHFGHPLPFNFEVAYGDDGVLSVTYLNGPERMPVEQVVEHPDGRIELNFPSYSATLSAQHSDGRLQGEIGLARRDGVQTFGFTAEPGPTHRFFATPEPAAIDVSGRWQATISYPGLGFDQDAVAILEQNGHRVHGTFMTDVGDFRFLYGEVRGRELHLSAYDGGYTQLWFGELDDEGRLAGRFDSATYAEATWVAELNPEARLVDPASVTWLQDGVERFDFTFPDLDGQPVSLSDPRYEGKVVIVVLAGSWCPSCHDEAAFMAPFYETHRDRGLAIVNLMFEYSNDFEDVREQVEAFRDRYDIGYDMLFAGDSSRMTRGSLLPALNGIFAFPTTIFVDRRGEVRRIHTSFPGPATGLEHDNYVRELRAFVDMLLAETPDISQPRG
ncbi:MAG: TlpA family protein disulfide reductase [Gammaproteobacteria bacterium]|nr:TlpA family protein disulfide reductase [Gammaproteobacteria bacterium]